MAITQSSALSQLRSRLGERGSGSETVGVWTNPELRVYLNEAQREIARRSEALNKSTTVSVSANTQTGTAPTDMVRIHKVDWYTSSTGSRYPLEYRDRDNLDRLWGTAEVLSRGTPEFWTFDGYPGGSGVITLFPTPGVNGTLKVYYYAFPADLATDTSAASSSMTIPSGWEDLLIDYAEFRALRQNRQAAEAQEALAQFEMRLAGLVDASTKWTDQPGQFINDPFYNVDDWGVW